MSAPCHPAPAVLNPYSNVLHRLQAPMTHHSYVARSRRHSQMVDTSPRKTSVESKGVQQLEEKGVLLVPT
jgi:hypothetical protein